MTAHLIADLSKLLGMKKIPKEFHREILRKFTKFDKKILYSLSNAHEKLKEEAKQLIKELPDSCFEFCIYKSDVVVIINQTETELWANIKTNLPKITKHDFMFFDTYRIIVFKNCSIQNIRSIFVEFLNDNNINNNLNIQEMDLKLIRAFMYMIICREISKT